MLDDSIQVPVSPGFSSRPRHLKWMRPEEVAATLRSDGRVIVPVGTCHAYDPALPLGAATIIVEKLADDLSAEFGVLRAPALEYGVNVDPPRHRSSYAGRVAVRKKTLHRTVNDLIASWELNGVTEFVILTAHGFDAHLEALTTLSTVRARVRTVDIFKVNLSEIAGGRINGETRSAPIQAMLHHIAPEFARPGVTEEEHTRLSTLGEALYERIRSRISERIFLAPIPTE